MLGETVTTNRYHVSLIRSQLTRHIISFFLDVTEEVMLAIQDNFPLTKGEFCCGCRAAFFSYKK